MKSRRVATFAEEGKWTSGADATMLVGDWQAWVDGEGHWKVRGPDPDNEAHYADGDIELTEAEYIEAGNSEARRKIRARRAKEAARAYIKTMTQPSKRQHATKKSPAQLQREIDAALAPKKVAGFIRSAGRKPGYQIVSVPILKGPRGIGPSGLDSPRERNESVVFASRGEAEAYLPSVKRFAADFGRDALIKEVW